ncbi:MAG: hypothetical protein OXC99_12535 [Chloroflexi bacterium]|nr:hypothetical protein [Chloroflexota bacterium]
MQMMTVASPVRELNLTEYKPSEATPLTAPELASLLSARKQLGVSVEPAQNHLGAYVVTPASTVGAVEIDGLSVVIKPKITMQQVLSLALYAMDADSRFHLHPFDFAEEDALPDLLAHALAQAAQRAFAQGLLHGYRAEEESLYGVRGRIRFDDQVRRRFGRALPIEARYDDFTDDILENRLVKAAAGQLAMMRLRSPAARRGLGWIAGTLANVSPVEYPLNNVPEVRFDRLNEHYRQVVTLARLVLRHTAYQSSRGAVRAIGFLFDMNDVFQRFVTRALRGKLQLSERAFPSDKKLPQKVTLDTSGQLNLLPDLSWWQDGKCVFVGDAKYKRILDERVPNADLYQLLAYATALNLPNGLLIYAESEANVASHTVRYANKQLEVTALDLNGNLDDVLERVGYLANRVCTLSISGSVSVSM